MKKDLDMTLYLVTDSTYHTEETFYKTIEEACQGGVTLVQLREKNCGGREYLEKAMKVNYQLILDKKIEELKGTVPTLLLHSCCGPCSTYVLEYLSKYFKITVVYYNPNIFPQEEYEHRLREQKKVIENMPFENPVDLIFEDYEHSDFIKNIKGLENEPEGGARCTECFRFRLEKTAELAKERKYDYFTTTLSVSPHKNSQLLNELGKEIG